MIDSDEEESTRFVFIMQCSVVYYVLVCRKLVAILFNVGLQSYIFLVIVLAYTVVPYL